MSDTAQAPTTTAHAWPQPATPQQATTATTADDGHHRPLTHSDCLALARNALAEQFGVDPAQAFAAKSFREHPTCLTDGTPVTRYLFSVEYTANGKECHADIDVDSHDRHAHARMQVLTERLIRAPRVRRVRTAEELRIELAR